jgi:hypothetical protein
VTARTAASSGARHVMAASARTCESTSDVAGASSSAAHDLIEDREHVLVRGHPGITNRTTQTSWRPTGFANACRTDDEDFSGDFGAHRRTVSF